VPADDLLTIVSLDYGLSRDYEPADLVPLSDYFGNDVTLGFPTMLRAPVMEPLTRLIVDMEAEGLAPVIRSGYRSYAQQVAAREKWIRQYPDRVNILSAPPGHSEHQLGTTVDFGSAELAEIVDDPDIEFHTYFYLTSEGQWLAASAYRYGFALSYPRQGQDLTGFFYEPWHYRYVGVEMATMLAEQGRFLLEYQLASNPPPCVP
jgi:D-alanyl-D-alanine carboxypeptidase